MRIKIFTLGTRGDVQPFIPLAIGLQNHGHEVTICTAKNFEKLITKHGVRFHPVRADYQELTQSEEGRELLSGNPLIIIKNMKKLVFPLIKQSLMDLWGASDQAELILYHPKAFGAYDIAEKLEIPAMITFPIPALTPTAYFQNPILPFRFPKGNSYFNKLSYKFNKLTTVSFHNIVNEWRVEQLNLPKKPMFRNELVHNGEVIPIIYCYSPAVVPPPPDWDPNNICVSGYWFLDSEEEWQPPNELIRFLEEGPSPICIGFSSMPFKNPTKFQEILKSVIKETGERYIILTGWSGLEFGSITKDVFVADSIPHSWLFPKCVAVVHHGGAGTVAATLRAGKPMIICPFIGDQPYWARVMKMLGVAPDPLNEKDITVERLRGLIKSVINEENGYIKKAEELGQKIRLENGVEKAIKFIHSKLQL